ncbi:MAG: transcription elongation factor GreA [Parcubacteria group bacterium Gr01-1014_18]|nr:MAG: transcription elongation factor GreA [Parcubacteria group bacterium Greene0416_36]TSC80093.1 MAG: transcription elongation factor GreA [Parcubacteria group bacterium Gr01-1014_18]TSC98617.1 MAG: transcription elongation factor GreA [Parcubacteria group bacterium Greene1014_20]TSD06444.1 MAG: transcription elongation factor GreA [Parcubacteria group bacterium Greene0714_2]
MRVPYRKPGQYTDMRPDPHITPAKQDELIRELESIKRRLPGMIQEVQRLAAMGDFSENAGYQIAKGALRHANWRVLEIEDALKQAIVFEKPASTDRVQLGHTVTFSMGGVTKKYQILGSSETDPNSSVISHNSPIGAALLGKRVGDSFTLHLANKEVVCEVRKIE